MTVEFIRASNLPVSKLAEMFRVSKSATARARSGYTWSDR